MRILLASDHYPPFVGGVQRQTRALALELQSLGHEVRVATVWQDDLPTCDDSDGFRVHRLRQLRTLPLLRGSPRRRHQPPFPDPVTALALRRIVREFRPDVVHSSGWFTHACAAALLGRSTPLLISAREYGFTCAKATMVYRGAPCSGPAPAKCLGCAGAHYGAAHGTVAVAGVWLSRPLLKRKVTAMHSVSRYVRDVMQRDLLGEAGEGIPHVVIPSFRVETSEEADAATLDALPREPFILFVGALRSVKGLAALFAAYRQLDSPPPLVLIGTWESDTPRDIPPGVVAPGPASYATVLAAWDRSLFGVMPSLWPEPFGSVVHEAMSRGKAVVGTSPGGHTDMIEDGETGLLVPPGDVGALRAAMQRLIDEDAFREELGRRAGERAQDFASEAAVPRFEALYDAAVAGCGR